MMICDLTSKAISPKPLTKYLTSPLEYKTSNIFFLDQQKLYINAQNLSNEQILFNDDDYGHNDEHMVKTDLSLVKNLMHSNPLDNRKKSAIFCCGDNYNVMNKYMAKTVNKNKPSAPGQAVQIIATQHNAGYTTTPILRNDEDGLLGLLHNLLRRVFQAIVKSDRTFCVCGWIG
uniref:Uncharacterized protein n=1 Tax=Glossina brevipalpis TaxID=37001 RepID=A0A1A9X1U1_9MUSC